MNVINSDKERWIRPWNITKFDNLENKDERFFAILIKGVLSFLNNRMVLYDKPIKHYILSTGSTYLYLEKNGYEYSFNETSGEDSMYMEMPRCIVEIGDINIPMQELSSPYSRGSYDRIDEDELKNFNAEIRRLPIEWNVSLKYVLSNFNESIILLEELLNNFVWQQYFSITYLGQKIKCSIELPQFPKIEVNKPDFSSDIHEKKIEINVKICSNYPLINQRSEIPCTMIINSFGSDMEIYKKEIENIQDTINKDIK